MERTKVKTFGQDEGFCVCPHCDKEYGRYSAFGKHIQEHKKNGTMRTEN